MIPNTLSINHRSCISQNTDCSNGVNRQTSVSYICHTLYWSPVITGLLAGTSDAFVLSYGYDNTRLYCFTNTPQFISIDLIDTEQIELKCNHPCPPLWIQDKIRKLPDHWTSATQQLRPQIPSLDVIPAMQTPWHQNTIWTFNSNVVTYKKEKEAIVTFLMY